MLDYHSLAKRPSQFHSFTGFKVAEFAKLVATIKDDWQALREQGRKKDRLRRVGGGSKLKLPALEDRLLVYCVYAKLYLPYVLMEYLFGVDESTICRIVQEMSTLLGQKIIIQRGGPRIRTLAELKAVFPDLDEVLVDATEQRINRPAKKRTRKKHHSGKKKAFTIKTQVVATRQKIVLHAADSVPGRTHDYRYFKETDVPDWLSRNPRIKARMDLGYQGANDDYPEADIILPAKRNRWQKTLTRSEKIMNTKKAKARIYMENTFANLKKFKILAGTYRNVKERYSETFRSVCFLSNFRTLERMTV